MTQAAPLRAPAKPPLQAPALQAPALQAPTLQAPPVATPQGASLVEEVVLVAEELAGTVDEETRLLTGARWLDMHRLAPEKSRLALRYDALARMLQDIPPAALALDPAAQELRVAAYRLDRAVKENARAITMHMDANRRVAELIAKAARDAAMPRVNYGRPGAARGARGLPHYGTTPSVAVCKVL